MSNADRIYDAIIIGAGAAGLFCALTAARRGQRILLLEGGEKPGAKILISGGGRCNFTNRVVKAANFFSKNPHFAKSALARYTPDDFIALIEEAGIAWREKTLGQLFCDGSARQIVNLLVNGCAQASVQIATGVRIGEVSCTGSEFVVQASGANYRAPALVIATGGPSIPKMGATDFAWRLGARFGLSCEPPRPALVPLTLTPADVEAAFGASAAAELAGVSFETVASIGKTAFREAALITHRGLSGPAILQISTPWSNGEAIALDLLPGCDSREFLRDGKRRRPRAITATLLGEKLPQRLAGSLAAQWSTRSDVPQDRPLADIPDRALDALAAHLSRCLICPRGTEGFAKAEVTAGGVSTTELSSRTLEAKKIPGLYVIGEAVDVTGWLGGYNFQWAWSSGWCAGQAL